MSLYRTSLLLLVTAFCAVYTTVFNARAMADEVTLTHRGLTLNANFEIAPHKTVSDGVLVILHGGLAHRDMETISYLRKLFRESGFNTLAINLSLGLDNRHGMFDCAQTQRHLNDDAVVEIGAWIKWLQAQQVKRVTLVGHSRGGAQTALFAAEQDSDMIEAVVLLAPATAENTNATSYQQRYGMPLAPLLTQAKQLLRQGRGATVLKHIGLLSCRETQASADSFISYYGQDPRLDTPYLLRIIRKPVFVAVAGNDAMVKNLDKKIAPLVDGLRLQMKIIDGADHMFRDLYADDAVEAITEFLRAIHPFSSHTSE